MYLTEDLSKLKVGDRAYCIFMGWGIIENISLDEYNYPSLFLFKPDNKNVHYSFNMNGCYFSCFPYQSLFTREVELNFVVDMEYENNK